MNYIRQFCFILLISMAVASPSVKGGIAKRTLIGGETNNMSGYVQKTKTSFRTEQDDDGRAIRHNHPHIAEPIETYREEQQELLKSNPTHAIPLTMPSSPVTVTGFSGTVHIGAAQAFRTVTSVVAALNFGAPVTGDITFVLDDASYTETGFNLGPITYGAGGPYTVTFRPNTGVDVTTTVTSSATGAFVLTGASHVLFEGASLDETPGGPCGDAAVRSWHISPSAYVSSTAGTIAITNGSSFITVADCNIEGILDNTNGSRAILLSNAAAPPVNSDIVIQNCLIHTGREGIVEFGVAAATLSQVSTNWDQRVAINGCEIKDLAQKGINLNNSKAPVIFCNKVHDIIYPATFPATTARYGGIVALNDQGARIRKNIIDNIKSLSTTDTGVAARVYGIRSQGLPVATDASFDAIVTDVRIQNNSITRVLGQGVAGGFRDVGIEIGGGRQDSVTHNTIYFTGSAGPNYDGSTCLQIFQVGRGFFGGPFPARCMAINNIFANDRDCGNFPQTLIRPFDDGGALDYRASSNNNVLYAPGPHGEVSPGYTTVADWRTYNANDAASVGYNPLMLAPNDPHWNTAGPSSASNLGSPNRVGDDIFGTLRSTVHPDAGCVEEATNAPLFYDAYLASINSPPATGGTIGLTVPVIISVGNPTQNTDPHIVVNAKIYDPNNTLVYDHIWSVSSLAAFSTVGITIPDKFTPTMTGSYTVIATLTMTSDGDTSNNSKQSVYTAVGLASVPYCTSFETDSDRTGWIATGDFVFGNFTKLGGPRTGSVAAVTKLTGNYTDYSCGGRDFLYTPFFDLRLIQHPTISFYQSIRTEPVWDGGRFEYSIDSGKTWNIVGAANSGINWYGGAYLNANNADPNCWAPNFGGANNCTGSRFTDFGMHEAPKWTSNGDCEASDIHTGPNGYVFVQYTDMAGNFGGRNYVLFRYNTFFDGAVGDEGIAIDDFCVQDQLPLPWGSICGVKFDDTNGNGIKDPGENAVPGMIVLSYYDVAIETTSTDGSGNYCFNSLIPGEYSLTSLKSTGVAVTTNGNVSNDGFQTLIVNIGNYQGTITGTKWNDLNKNGQKDLSEPGLQGWTIELHSDSCNGLLLGTTVTDANGDYMFATAPGTYFLKEVHQTNWIATSPPGTCIGPVVISGPSGGLSSSSANNNFGNFQLATIRLENYVDNNGDGIQDAQVESPYDAVVAYEVRRNGNLLFTDSLRDGNSVLVHAGLDVGTYAVNKVFLTPGWVTTFGSAYTFTISTSGTLDTARSLIFQMPSACGKKVEDVNGDGLAAGDPPPPTVWTICISGTVYGEACTQTD
ncbi:MAG: hypothetical protein HY033_11835, partial [Ignavibacteriae bacterium]|nr:hypothetical protein [Ignavibacteria bacterium]MBI3365584.1 hypothetical protein [Ignavibacteriota bacterium]